MLKSARTFRAPCSTQTVASLACGSAFGHVAKPAHSTAGLSTASVPAQTRWFVAVLLYKMKSNPSLHGRRAPAPAAASNNSATAGRHSLSFSSLSRHHWGVRRGSALLHTITRLPTRGGGGGGGGGGRTAPPQAITPVNRAVYTTQNSRRGAHAALTSTFLTGPSNG